MKPELPDHFKDADAALARIKCKHEGGARIWHDRSEKGENRCYTVCLTCDRIIRELPRTTWFD